MKKQEAKRIGMLFKKHKKLFKSYYETASFKEPVLILMRRGNKADFLEKATAGEFEIDHSDGSKRVILLNPKNLQTFDYGSKTFRGYICHEDFPVALPEEPLVSSEMFNIAVNKTLNDIKKWKAQEIKAKTDFIWKAAMGIALVIAAYALYRLLAPDPPLQVVQSVASGAVQAGKQIVKNGTTVAVLG